MGRRKIEIQPITHERNRSVTFLKRKNGLFKKAYELGVLCSVDVAVIIFEERPGHHVKLYQYCSGNIDEIVQRHAKYDGEKDIRAPGDFSNNSSAKLDDLAEGDDDDAEDEDLEPSPAKGNIGIKKGGETKPRIDAGAKMRPSASNGGDLDIEYPAHRPMSIPNPPMPMLTTSSSSIPISGERLISAPRMSSGSGTQHTSGSNKKQRLASDMDGGRSPQEDIGLTIPGYGYHPAPHMYRGLHPNEQYGPFFPMGTTQSYPSGPSFDYPPSRMQYRPMGYPPTRSMPPYNQPPDPHFMRPMHQQYQQHHPGYPPMMTSQQHPSDIFAAYLDGDPRQHPGPGFGPIDWPVHAGVQDGRLTHGQGDPNDVSWLDFLSGNVPPPSGGPMHATPSMPPGGRDHMSWERDASSGPVASRPSSRLSSTASDLAPHTANPHKRSRANSEAGGAVIKEQSQDVEMKPPASTKTIQKPGEGRAPVDHDSDNKTNKEE